MLITAVGVVIAERNYGETDKFIDVLTAEYGVVEICVKGARKIYGKSNSATQLFAYSKFSFNSRADRYYLSSSEVIKVFYGLRIDIKKLVLAEYFAELIRHCATTGQTAKDIMRLFLNTLYFLSEDLRSCEFLKSVFEMRLMSEIGMLPQLIGCRECYRYETEEMYFLADHACLLCGDHFEYKGFEEDYFHIRINHAVLEALRFICLAGPERLFNFRIGERSMKLLNEITEKYIFARIGTSFKSLDFCKKICEPVEDKPDQHN